MRDASPERDLPSDIRMMAQSSRLRSLVCQPVAYPQSPQEAAAVGAGVRLFAIDPSSEKKITPALKSLHQKHPGTPNRRAIRSKAHGICILQSGLIADLAFCMNGALFDQASLESHHDLNNRETRTCRGARSDWHACCTANVTSKNTTGAIQRGCEKRNFN